MGGNLDHVPVFIELEPFPSNRHIPFKLNPSWMDGPTLISLLKDTWFKFSPGYPKSPSLNFQRNLKKSKVIIYEWAKNKREEYLKKWLILNLNYNFYGINYPLWLSMLTSMLKSQHWRNLERRFFLNRKRNGDSKFVPSRSKLVMTMQNISIGW